jgi:hypothetical protein
MASNVNFCLAPRLVAPEHGLGVNVLVGIRVLVGKGVGVSVGMIVFVGRGEGEMAGSHVEAEAGILAQ